MADLYFDEEADAVLSSLERDPNRRELALRVGDILAALEEDPRQAWLRRRRFQIGVWCVVVAAQDDPWALLWEPHPAVDDAVIIHYLGPASFA